MLVIKTTNDEMQKSLSFVFIISVLLNACTRISPLEESNPKPLQAQDTAVTSINFAGLTWDVKEAYSSTVGPGPNYFSKDNVWVDVNGKLHLKIRKVSNNKWTCAELKTQQLFVNGVYQFWVEGRPDLFDKNIVLGLFSYPCVNDICEPDGTHEIDIEFAKWGNANETENLIYNAYPTMIGGANYHKTFPVSLAEGTYSTHRYTRSSSSVFFQSLYGHRKDDTGQFVSTTSTNTVSTLAMPVYINLWLFKGKLPSDENEVEIVIRDFKFLAQ